MVIANYSTTVDARQTALEIYNMLVAHNAKNINIDYDKESGIAIGLSFTIPTSYGDLSIRLPVNAKDTSKSLSEHGLPPRYYSYNHAVKVAWRITKDWIRAQMAYIDTGMVRLEQVFLPYMLTQDNRTYYEAISDNRFRLTGGR